MIQHIVGNAQISRNVRQRFLARLGKLYCFYLTFFRTCALSSYAWSFPIQCRSHSFKCTFHIFLGQDHYEERRMKRSAAIIEHSYVFGKIGQWEHPLLCWLRDGLTPLSFATFLPRQFVANVSIPSY